MIWSHCPKALLWFGAVLTLSNSQILRVLFYPIRQWFQKKHKEQCITVVQMCKFGKSTWSFSESSHLFPVSLPRYLLTASSQPVHFDRGAELAGLAFCQGLCSRAFILWGQWAHLWDGDQSSRSITLPWASEEILDVKIICHLSILGQMQRIYNPDPYMKLLWLCLYAVSQNHR